MALADHRSLQGELGSHLVVVAEALARQDTATKNGPIAATIFGWANQLTARCVKARETSGAENDFGSQLSEKIRESLHRIPLDVTAFQGLLLPKKDFARLATAGANAAALLALKTTECTLSW
ncbi:unnamed protein product, partial [Amoebophrya sp. A25]|eukprot:GSA25T00002125001.1